jgi:hypothetical protein
MPPRRAIATTAAWQTGYQANKRGSQGLQAALDSASAAL